MAVVTEVTNVKVVKVVTVVVFVTTLAVATDMTITILETVVAVVQTLGCKTSGAAPPQFCSLRFSLGKSLGSPHTSP